MKLQSATSGSVSNFWLNISININGVCLYKTTEPIRYVLTNKLWFLGQTELLSTAAY